MERDSVPSRLNSSGCYFNSHAHVERDTSYLVVIAVFEISTHTLTWSVTIVMYIVLGAIEISTHTLTWSVTQ